MKRLKSNEYVVVSCNLILYMVLTTLKWKASPCFGEHSIFFPDLQIFNTDFIHSLQLFPNIVTKSRQLIHHWHHGLTVYSTWLQATLG